MEQEATNIVAEGEQQMEELKGEVAGMNRKEENGISSAHTFASKVTLDVGGHLFTTTIDTLTRYPDTMLGAMFSGRYALTPDTNGAYFIDRDGTHFREILNFLRGPTASKESKALKFKEELKFEADFYGVTELMFPVVAETELPKFLLGDDQLWYLQSPSFKNHRPIVVCNHCLSGFVQVSKKEHDIDEFEYFTSDRIITSKQPTFMCYRPKKARYNESTGEHVNKTASTCRNCH